MDELLCDPPLGGHIMHHTPSVCRADTGHDTSTVAYGELLRLRHVQSCVEC